MPAAVTPFAEFAHEGAGRNGLAERTEHYRHYVTGQVNPVVAVAQDEESLHLELIFGPCIAIIQLQLGFLDHELGEWYVRRAEGHVIDPLGAAPAVANSDAKSAAPSTGLRVKRGEGTVPDGEPDIDRLLSNRPPEGGRFLMWKYRGSADAAARIKAASYLR